MKKNIFRIVCGLSATVAVFQANPIPSKSVQQRLDELEKRIIIIEQHLGLEPEELNLEARPTEASTFEPPEEEVLLLNSPEALFKHATQLLKNYNRDSEKKDSLEEALRYFTQLQQNYATHKLATEAMFWSAEIQSQLGRHKDALRSYKKYIENTHEKGRAYYTAHYKLALSLKKLNETRKVCAFIKLTRQKHNKEMPEDILRMFNNLEEEMGC